MRGENADQVWWVGTMPDLGPTTLDLDRLFRDRRNVRRTFDTNEVVELELE